MNPCTNDDGSADSYPCYWDAAHQGNGLGTSFTAYADGTIVPDAPPATEASVVAPVAPVAPVALAHTGIDPVGAVVATLAILAGVGMVSLRRLAR